MTSYTVSWLLGSRTGHVSGIVNKAIVRCKLINKCFASRHAPTLIKAFKIYVRPILEYCAPVWSPHLVKDTELVESVQRRFTKWLPGLRNMSYSKRLTVTGLERLDARRLRVDLITTYKILFGLTCLQSTNFFRLSPTLNKTRGHDYKLLALSSNSDTRKYFFSNRVIHAWNGLPPDKVNFSSLKTFKTSLFKLNLSAYYNSLPVYY